MQEGRTDELLRNSALRGFSSAGDVRLAIYHCSMKPVSRGGGRSAVAAIAYRTASRMINERENVWYDFTRKTGVVQFEIVLPEGLNAK
jgi:hypothetical protein